MSKLFYISLFTFFYSLAFASEPDFVDATITGNFEKLTQLVQSGASLSDGKNTVLTVAAGGNWGNDYPCCEYRYKRAVDLYSDSKNVKKLFTALAGVSKSYFNDSLANYAFGKAISNQQFDLAISMIQSGFDIGQPIQTFGPVTLGQTNNYGHIEATKKVSIYSLNVIWRRSYVEDFEVYSFVDYVNSARRNEKTDYFDLLKLILISSNKPNMSSIEKNLLIQNLALESNGPNTGLLITLLKKPTVLSELTSCTTASLLYGSFFSVEIFDYFKNYFNIGINPDLIIDNVYDCGSVDDMLWGQEKQMTLLNLALHIRTHALWVYGEKFYEKIDPIDFLLSKKATMGSSVYTPFDFIVDRRRISLPDLKLQEILKKHGWNLD